MSTLKQFLYTYKMWFIIILLFDYRCSNYENENENLKREKSALEVRISEMQRRRYSFFFFFQYFCGTHAKLLVVKMLFFMLDVKQ